MIQNDSSQQTQHKLDQRASFFPLDDQSLRHNEQTVEDHLYQSLPSLLKLSPSDAVHRSSDPSIGADYRQQVNELIADRFSGKHSYPLIMALVDTADSYITLARFHQSLDNHLTKAEQKTPPHSSSGTIDTNTGSILATLASSLGFVKLAPIALVLGTFRKQVAATIGWGATRCHGLALNLGYESAKQEAHEFAEELVSEYGGGIAQRPLLPEDFPIYLAVSLVEPILLSSERTSQQLYELDRMKAVHSLSVTENIPSNKTIEGLLTSSAWTQYEAAKIVAFGYAAAFLHGDIDTHNDLRAHAALALLNLRIQEVLEAIPDTNVTDVNS